MAASAIYLFKLFLLSRKQVTKSLSLLRTFQNVLRRRSKLYLRSCHDHGHIIYDQA